MYPFCIATWNLNYLPLTGDRADLLRGIMAEVGADIWVLTETREGFQPGEHYRLVAESEPASDLSKDRRWTAIWARDTLYGARMETGDPERTACARLAIPGGFPLYVYGTVLPWRGSTWRGYASAGGRAFSESLAVQKADWLDIQGSSFDGLLCVAGDFNQDLLASGHYYGSKKERTLLEDAIAQAHLKCITAGAADPVVKLDPLKATVDHICIGGTQPVVTSINVLAWPPCQQEKVLSDHYGVSAAFTYS